MLTCLAFSATGSGLATHSRGVAPRPRGSQESEANPKPRSPHENRRLSRKDHVAGLSDPHRRPRVVLGGVRGRDVRLGVLIRPTALARDGCLASRVAGQRDAGK